MHWFKVSGKFIALAMCFFIVATPLLAQQADNKTGDYIQGRADGELDGKGSAGYLLLGVVCGVIGFVIAAVSNPSPPPERIMGKSREYVLGYTDGYRSKAKNKNMVYAGIGWGISAIIAIIIMTSTEDSSGY